MVALAGLRLLLVDDDPMARNVFRRWLTRSAMIVTEVGSGRAACTLLLQQSFDLVVSDMFMPEMSGVELAAWIQERHASLPVLLVSSFPERAADVDFTVIAKPLTGDEMANAIAHVLTDPCVNRRLRVGDVCSVASLLP
jgi:CheY-like chemotaxis protein